MIDLFKRKLKIILWSYSHEISTVNYMKNRDKIGIFGEDTNYFFSNYYNFMNACWFYLCWDMPYDFQPLIFQFVIFECLIGFYKTSSDEVDSLVVSECAVQECSHACNKNLRLYTHAGNRPINGKGCSNIFFRSRSLK